MFKDQIRRYFVKRGTTPIDFVFLDGGRLCVPEGEVHAFLDVYNKHVKSERIHLVERVTAVFPYFVDIDYVSQKAPMLEGDRDYLARLIFDFLRDVVGVDSRMLICTANRPKIKQGQYYDGVHLHWPEFYVTKETALQVRNLVVQHVQQTIGSEWDEIIDAAVYKTGSLRMKGSYKVGEDRFYWPKAIYSGCEVNKWDPTNDGDVVRLCSVRAHVDQAPTPINLPELPAETSIEPSTAMIPCAGERLSDVSEVAKMILQRFREYRNVPDFEIRDVIVFKRSAIIHTKCKFCLNKGGYHNSCTVYFHVNNSANDPCIYFRCFSHKMYNGRQCSENRTIRRYYHKELFALLFDKK